MKRRQRARTASCLLPIEGGTLPLLRLAANEEPTGLLLLCDDGVTDETGRTARLAGTGGAAW